jgi:hypothetical protein
MWNGLFSVINILMYSYIFCLNVHCRNSSCFHVCLVKYMRFHVLTATNMKMTAFWYIAPCSLVEVNRRFRSAYCLHHQGDNYSIELFISLMMEVVRTSDTSANFNEITRQYITEGCQLHGNIYFSFEVLSLRMFRAPVEYGSTFTESDVAITGTE